MSHCVCTLSHYVHSLSLCVSQPYWHLGWNRLDGTIVLFTWLTLTGSWVPPVKILRLGRTLRPLRLVCQRGTKRKQRVRESRISRGKERVVRQKEDTERESEREKHFVQFLLINLSFADQQKSRNSESDGRAGRMSEASWRGSFVGCVKLRC